MVGDDSLWWREVKEKCNGDNRQQDIILLKSRRAWEDEVIIEFLVSWNANYFTAVGNSYGVSFIAAVGDRN